MCSFVGEGVRDAGTKATARTRDPADLSVQVQPVGIEAVARFSGSCLM